MWHDLMIGKQNSKQEAPAPKWMLPKRLFGQKASPILWHDRIGIFIFAFLCFLFGLTAQTGLANPSNMCYDNTNQVCFVRELCFTNTFV